MPSVSPIKSLTGIKLREFFPVTAAANVAPAFAATLIGPIRTVVPASQGKLGGVTTGTLAPTLKNDLTIIKARFDFTVVLSDCTVELGGVIGNNLYADGGLSAIGGMQVFIDQLKASPFTNKIIKEVLVTPGATKRIVDLTFVFSDYAIKNGLLCPLINEDPASAVVITDLTSASILVGVSQTNQLINAALDYVGAGQNAIYPTKATSSVIGLPALSTKWDALIKKPISSQTLFGIDTDPERHYFDMTKNQIDAYNNYVGAEAVDNVFYGDSSFAWNLADVAVNSSITVSNVALPGTQRVTAFCIQTGIEYELRHISDKAQTGGGAAGVTEYEWTVVGTGSSDGAYDTGSVISFQANSPSNAGSLLQFSATNPFRNYIIRANYIPVRYASPLPFFNFKALSPGASDILVPATVNDFTVDEVGNTFKVLPKVASPSSARISYNKSVQITTVASGVTTLINLAPDLTKTVIFNATAFGGIAVDLNAPNIATVVVKDVGGTVIPSGGNYTFVSVTGLITPTVAGALTNAINNPVSITVTYSPMVSFVDAPVITFSGLSAAPSGWLESSFPPPATSLGGGRYRVLAQDSSPGDIIGSFQISATIEYPIAPEVQLEFAANRSDIDGKLTIYPDITTMQADADFIDVYQGQTITPDVSTANPTLHAAKLALTATPGIPIFIGIGDMTPTRSTKVLQRLEREFNAYHLVALSQDSTSVLSLVGAHVDKVVATFAGDQVHFNTGKFRVMYVTLDQRNEVQFVPLQKDTLTTGLGRFAPGTTGGVAVKALAAGLDLSSVAPGDFVEYYEVDATADGAITGDANIKKSFPKRLRIDSVVVSGADVFFNITDVSVPAILSFPGSFHILRPSPFRIIRVRDDFTLASDLRDTVAAIGSATNGRRRWVRQPDLVTVNDGGTQFVVPGYYRSVIEASVRANSLPHQGLSRFPLPLLTGVNRNIGFYSSDDVINIMTDGGIDYAVQEVPNGPVFSVQQLTANRTNKFTQAPTVTQIMDFLALSIYNSLKIFLGVTNVTDENLNGIAAVTQSVIARLKNIRNDKLGSMILSGTIFKIEPLPETSVNSGVLLCVKAAVAEAIEEIDVDLFVDTESSAV